MHKHKNTYTNAHTAPFNTLAWACARPRLSNPPNPLPTLFSSFLLSATSLNPTSTLKLRPCVSPTWRHCGSSGIMAILSLGTMSRGDRITASTADPQISLLCVSSRVHLYDWILCVHDYPETLFIFMVLCFSSSQCVWQRNQVLYPRWTRWELLMTLTAASAVSVLSSASSLPKTMTGFLLLLGAP